MRVSKRGTMMRQVVIFGTWMISGLLSFQVAAAAATQSTGVATEPGLLTGVVIEQTDDGSLIVLEGVTTDAYEVMAEIERNLVVLQLDRVLIDSAAGKHLAPVEVHDGLVERVSASSHSSEKGMVTRVEVLLGAPADYEVMMEPRGLVMTFRSAEPALERNAALGSGQKPMRNESSDGDPWALAESMLRADVRDAMDAGESDIGSYARMLNLMPENSASDQPSAGSDAVGPGLVSVEPTSSANEPRDVTEESRSSELRDDLTPAETEPNKLDAESEGVNSKSADAAMPERTNLVSKSSSEEADAVPTGEPEPDFHRPIAVLEADDLARLAATTLKGVKAVTMKHGVLVHLEADGLLGDASYLALSDPARLVVDLIGVRNGVSQARFRIDSPQVKRIRLGNHEDKTRVVFDAGSAPVDFDNPRMVSSQSGLYLSLGEGPDLEHAFSDLLMGEPMPTATNEPLTLAVPVATVSTPPDVLDIPTAALEPVEATEIALIEEPMPSGASTLPLPAQVMSAEPILSGAEGRKADAASASPPRVHFIKSERDSEATGSALPVPAEIFGLQFERSQERDRVAILTDSVVDYSIFEPDAETVMIRIPNARFTGDSGERITPDSGGPVSLITTFEQPDLEGSEVRVVMRRARGLVPVVTRRATVILVDFQNSGVAASAPPAFLADEPPFLSERETYANRLETEGRLPTKASGPAGDDVDPATSPVQELKSDVPPGVTERHAFAAALGAAHREPEKKTSAGPAKLATSSRHAEAAPAAVAMPAAVDVLSEGGLIEEKKYTGRRISLDFKDVLVSDVLRLIAEVSDLNIIAGDEVNGAMTIRLVDVPWDQALDVILLTKGLGFMRVGNVLRIAPSETLKAEEETRLQERRQREKLEDLEVKLQPINYANINDMKGLVSRLLSPRGTVNVDVRTSTVIIKDISSVINEAVALIMAIDTETPQVMIEAKIVEANLDFSRKLGSTWSLGSQPFVDGFNPGALATNLGSENFKFAGQNNVVVGNPITSSATGAVNFGAFLLDDKMQVDVHIQAMEQAGDGKVISSPRVVTLDNREASIEQGVSIPFQTFESGDAKLEFIDAVLSLKVTPHITRDKSIIMSLEVTRNAPDTSVPTSTGSPAIAKNQAKTETLVKDGQTLVIGGIYTIDKTTRESRVPYLHKIPLIGRAFKSREVSDKRKELLIFVTPRIVVNPALASAR